MHRLIPWQIYNSLYHTHFLRTPLWAPISSYLGSRRTHLWPTVHALVQLQQCRRRGAKSKLQPALPSKFHSGSYFDRLPSTFTRYSASIKRRVFRPERAGTTHRGRPAATSGNPLDQLTGGPEPNHRSVGFVTYFPRRQGTLLQLLRSSSFSS